MHFEEISQKRNDFGQQEFVGPHYPDDLYTFGAQHELVER
jgi:hypothetical protein